MNRCLFIWIPRTSGTSIVQACCSVADKPRVMMLSHAHYRYRHDADFVTFGHRSIQVMAKRGRVNLADIESRYVFTVIRNPWERLVSLWHFALIHLPVETPITFRSFVRKVLFARRIRPTTKANHVWKIHARNQESFAVDIAGAEVWKYESLDRDWGRLGDRLGVALPARPEVNGVCHKDYRSYYDEELAAMVADYARWAIDAGGYRFDNCNLIKRA